MEQLVDVLKESDNILTDKTIISEVLTLKPSINKVVSECILSEVPIPSLSESVNFLNGYATANSSANIIQAQRDYLEHIHIKE